MPDQAGAVEAEGADEAARFVQLCNAYGLPIVSLIDTPGFMVEPEIEGRTQVRHVCRMFVVGAHLTVPFFAVFLRRGYGVGTQALAKGASMSPSSQLPGLRENLAGWDLRAR